jgi:hypothetical protein
MTQPAFAWGSLSPRSGPLLSALRIPDLPPGLPVYIAEDPSGVRYLLVTASPKTQLALSTLRTRALDVRLEALSVSELPSATFLVLACADPDFHALFDTLLTDAISELRRSPQDAVDVTLRTIERWRRFWNAPSSSMSDEAALGLFGELWFLRNWVPNLNRANLLAWRGPLDSTHDFQWPRVSVEVKASASRRQPLRHRISGLDQLAPPSTGNLFLFSLHLLEDELAGNSLAGLVRAIRAELIEARELQDLLDERLIAAGYGPSADDKAARCYRVQTEALYRVDEGFPRLVPSSFPSGLPTGVVNLTYEISMDVCVPFHVSSGRELIARVLT